MGKLVAVRRTSEGTALIEKRGGRKGASIGRGKTGREPCNHRAQQIERVVKERTDDCSTPGKGGGEKKEGHWATTCPTRRSAVQEGPKEGKRQCPLLTRRKKKKERKRIALFPFGIDQTKKKRKRSSASAGVCLRREGKGAPPTSGGRKKGGPQL